MNFTMGQLDEFLASTDYTTEFKNFCRASFSNGFRRWTASIDEFVAICDVVFLEIKSNEKEEK